MTVDWQTFAALVTSFAGIAALTMWLIGSVVDKRLAQFLEKLNGTYLRRELAEARFKQIEDHFDYLRDVKSR